MNSARDIAIALGGKWYRTYGTAPCPCCQPERRKEQNALTLRDGHGMFLLHCKKLGCHFVDILRAAGLRSGDYKAPDSSVIAQRKAQESAYAAKKARQAYNIWQEAEQIEGTLADTYLRGRGITCPLPKTLRFHPSCWHGPTARAYPAMIAAVQGVDNPAIHRTYLLADGSGKAEIKPNKLMLGMTAGGAARLTEAQAPLVVAEGIETALSLASGLLGRPATIWAALSTSGLQGLRLPSAPARLTIATDGDPAGANAGHSLAARAHALGWQVSLLSAPDGKDWNDILAMKGAIE